MEIGAILEELKRGKSLADIAKELEIGKEKLSKALKEANYSFSRKDGWVFNGTDSEPLNKAYTEFISQSRSVKSTNVPTNVDTNEPTNEPIKETRKERTKETTKVVRKRSSFDIDVALLKDLKIQAVIHDKKVYEIVENAIRKELASLKK